MRSRMTKACAQPRSLSFRIGTRPRSSAPYNAGMTDASAMTPERFTEIAQQIEAQVSRVIVGQRDVIRHTLIAIIAGNHVLLEGVPGLGKTSLVRAFADALSLRFVRIQFTPDLMPADIVGTDILEEQEGGKRGFRFQPGPIFANLVLADEINRATPKTQSALLEAMQERTVSVLGRTYATSKPFFVLATQNPIEMEGTYPLPEAQLDRFMFKLNVRFPNVDELTVIIEQTTGDKAGRAEKVADGKHLDRAEPIRAPGAGGVTRHALRRGAGDCHASRRRGRHRDGEKVCALRGQPARRASAAARRARAGAHEQPAITSPSRT
jgi:MoxR-like ATPase